MNNKFIAISASLLLVAATTLKVTRPEEPKDEFSSCMVQAMGRDNASRFNKPIWLYSEKGLPEERVYRDGGYSTSTVFDLNKGIAATSERQIVFHGTKSEILTRSVNGRPVLPSTAAQMKQCMKAYTPVIKH